MLLNNDIIKYPLTGEYYRFLYENNCKYFFIKLFTSKIVIISPEKIDIEKEIYDGVAVVEDSDPVYRITDEQNLAKGTIDLLDKAAQIIEYIYSIEGEPGILYKNIRRHVILKAIEKFDVSEKTIYKYLRKYWQGGKLRHSLLSNFYKCGARGKDKDKVGTKLGRTSNYTYKTGELDHVFVNEEVKGIFNISYNAFVGKMSLPKIYEQMIGKYFSDENVEGNESTKKVKDMVMRPTFRQFKYWVNKNKKREEDLIREIGEKKFNLNYRSLNSDSIYETNGPGFRYQVDATIADVYLVNSMKRDSVIGRPVVYTAVDVFSREITSLHICLEGPSWVGVSSLLYNCMEDKVQYCKKYGIDIHHDDWPCVGMPKVILADRGEFISKEGERAIKNLHIAFEFAPTGRGDAKGIVEQNFHIINSEIKHWLPGNVKKEYRERGQRDCRLDAKLDIYEFTQIMIYTVLKRNRSLMKNYPLSPEMVQDGINPIPNEIWNWGIKNKTGNLRRVQEEVLRVNLMRKDKAVVTENGIQFNNGLYTCSIAEEEKWYSRARKNGRWYVNIVYDNRNLNNIYIMDEKNNTFTKCALNENSSLNALYKGKTYEEIVDYHFEKNVRNKRMETDMLDIACEMNDNIQSVIENAIDKSEGRKIAKVTDIEENRKNENSRLRKEQALTNSKGLYNQNNTEGDQGELKKQEDEIDLKKGFIEQIARLIGK